VVQSLEQVSAASVRCMIRRGWQRKKKRGGGSHGRQGGIGGDKIRKFGRRRLGRLIHAITDTLSVDPRVVTIRHKQDEISPGGLEHRSGRDIRLTLSLACPKMASVQPPPRR
jgi:hypothetical protein